MMRFMEKVFLMIVTVLLLSSPVLAENKPVVTVGILTDGPMESYEAMRSLFFNEFKEITAGEFVIRFPQARQLDGQWSLAGIRAGLKTLQNDSEVDLVLVLGLTAARIAVASDGLKKPTFVPFLFNTDIFGTSSKNGASGIKNLNYLTVESQFDQDVQTFLSVVQFSHLGIVMDELHYQAFPDAVSRAIRMAADHGVTLEFITNSDANEDLMAKIPDDIEAVMVAPLPRLSSAAQKNLIDGLIQRQLPGFTYDDGISVEKGMLMSSVPAIDISHRARRTALNIDAVLKGAKAETQPVNSEQKRRLTINMATARAIGVFPSFHVLNSALVLNPEADVKTPALSLSQVAEESVRVNLDLIAGQLGVRSGREYIVEARSVLFPKLTGNMNYVQVNEDNPYVRIGYTAEKTTAGAIRLEQVIFSERVLAKLEIAKQLQVAREAQQRSLELDIVEQATAGFLNILMAQTRLQIQQDNLKLTQSNLDLAKNRVAVGQTDLSDIYRWESEIAIVEQNVLQSQAAVEMAWDAVNRILHRPLEDRFATIPATLDDPDLLISRERDTEYGVR